MTCELRPCFPSHSRRNNTMTVDESYTVINDKVTTINGLYFAHLVSTVLRPIFWRVVCGRNRSENRVFNCLRHSEIRP